MTLKSDVPWTLEGTTVFSRRSKCGKLGQVYSSLPFPTVTSHDQFARFVLLESKRTISELNRSQFRQVYSSVGVISFTLKHDTRTAEKSPLTTQERSQLRQVYSSSSFIPFTPQFQICDIEIDAFFLQVSNLNYFQPIHVLNLTR